MDKSYVIPQSVKITFDKKELPQLCNRVYRILWISIAIGHLKDQYFDGYIAKTVRMLKKAEPQSFKEFMEVIACSPVSRYGKKEGPYSSVLWWSSPGSFHKRWWRQVWNLIAYNGDIELVQVTKNT